MDTNHIRLFLTYAKTQNLRATAELHRTSHVNVIRAIRALEIEIGTKLTRRVGRGSELTRNARSLVKSAECLLFEEQNLLRASSGIPTEFSPIRVATFEVFSTHLAPEINRCFAPDRSVSWLERIPGGIEQAIVKSEADLGITYTPVPTEGAEHLPIGSAKMAVYQSERSRFDKLPIAKVPFVVPIQEDFLTPTRARGLDGWPNHKLPRFVRYRVTLLESALAMVASGQCVGFFPTFVVDRYNEGREKKKLKMLLVPAVKSVHQDVFIVKRRSEDETAEIRAVARVLRRLK
jgi:DNA-binding transcriptional LysR family regulator